MAMAQPVYECATAAVLSATRPAHGNIAAADYTVGLAAAAEQIVPFGDQLRSYGG